MNIRTQRVLAVGVSVKGRCFKMRIYMYHPYGRFDSIWDCVYTVIDAASDEDYALLMAWHEGNKLDGDVLEAVTPKQLLHERKRKSAARALIPAYVFQADPDEIVSVREFIARETDRRDALRNSIL